MAKPEPQPRKCKEFGVVLSDAGMHLGEARQGVWIVKEAGQGKVVVGAFVTKNLKKGLTGRKVA